ncbi:MAG: TonB-dependent receptor [Bacteroidota bacterium]
MIIKSKRNSSSLSPMIKTFIYFILLLNTIYSADKKDIRGTIRDLETGETLVYANIIIEGSNYGATTNQDGFFIIIDAPTELCTLLVSYMGYESKKIPYDNKKSNSKKLDIQLKPISIVTDDVTVIAEKYKIWKTADEVSQITLSPKQLMILPKLGEVDIFRSLQLLPGVSGISDGSSGLYVRGGTPDQNLILLDGMTVYHVDHFFGFFSAFNADAVKDVQFYKGGFSAKYGGRMSSVVDLTGKSGSVNKFKLNVGLSSLSINSVAEIPVFDKGSILISARRSYSDIIQTDFYQSIYGFLSGGDESEPRINGRGEVMEQSMMPSFYFYDLNAKFSYQLSNKDFISFSFYNGEDNLDESQEPKSMSGPGGNSSLQRFTNDYTNWGNLGGSAKWSRQWNDRLYSNILVSATDYFNIRNSERGFTSTDDGNTSGFLGTSFKSVEDNNVSDFTVRLDNEWKLSNAHKLSFGLWYSDVNTSFLMTRNDTLTILDRNSASSQLAAYVSDKFNLFSPLVIDLGGRLTYYEATNSLYIEPRFSAIYSLTDKLKFKGSWGQYTQFINHITNEDILEGTRDFWMVADDYLKPGFATHYILGAEFQTNDYLFSIEGYYKELENLVEFNQRITSLKGRGGTTPQTTTVEENFFFGDGYSKGIEFLIQKKAGDFNGWLSYTLGQVEYTFPEFNDGLAFPASHDRRHEVNFVASYKIGNWNLSASWVFATGKAYTAPESQYYLTMLDGDEYAYTHVSDKNANRLPDYQRLDLSATYSFKVKKSYSGDVGLSIYNLYDYTNVWYRQYDLETSPIVITDVTMLGITPTLFIKVYF